MAKILISDLFGTIIPSSISKANYSYGNGNESFDLFRESEEEGIKIIKKMIYHVSLLLRRYLQEENRLNIVTSVESHDPANFVFQEFISPIYKLLEEYSRQISVYFQTQNFGTDIIWGLSKCTTLYEKDGITYAKGENGIDIALIESKEKVFDIMRREEGDTLFAIGDSDVDLPMLVRCLELGGQSSVINENFFRTTQYYRETGYGYDDIIHETIFREIEFEADRLVRMLPGSNDFDIDRYCSIKFDLMQKVFDSEFFSMRREQYYALLREQKLDFNDLMRKNELYRMIMYYNKWYHNSFHRDQELDIENLLERIGMYPSFSDYSQKVLWKN